MNATDHESQHRELALLLPWYVNDTLENAEREQVALHLAVCDECADAVTSLQAIKSGLIDDRLTPIMPTPNPELVLERADSRAASRRVFAVAASIVLAAVLLLVAITTQDSLQPTVFETATSGNVPVEMSYGVRLKFVEGTSESERQKIFERINATSIRISDDGIYAVNIALSIESLDELSEVEQRIAALPAIAEASITSMIPAAERSQ